MKGCEDHKFWTTQPTISTSSTFQDVKDEQPFWSLKPKSILDPRQECSPIVNFTPQDMRDEPARLPKGYKWITFDIVEKQKDLTSLCSFLKRYYCQDPQNKFRLQYSESTLFWILTPPGFHKDWHLGIVQVSNNNIVGTITGVPRRLNIGSHQTSVVEINFLCVSDAYRGRSMAPILIKEVSRRVASTGLMTGAIHTGSLELPHSIATTTYHHRPLNMRKLLRLKFCYQHPKLTMTGTLKHYTLPTFTPCSGLRELRSDDVEECCKLLNTHLSKFKVSVIFSPVEFAHHFLPRQNVVHSYVVEKDGKVINFVSFHCLDIKVLHSRKDDIIKAVYLSYLLDTSIMPEILTLAARLGYDVFNCLDIMNSAEFITTCKFIVGTGKANYYLYNWTCPEIKGEDIGIVLL